MKTWIIWLFTLVALSPAVAQDDPQEVVPQDPKAREKVEAAKIGLISTRLGLSPEQAEKFWPVYKEFSDQRAVLRRELRQATESLKGNPDPTRQQEIINQGLSIKQRELDLEKNYSDRFLRIITAQQLLNLRGAERDFHRMILNQLQQRRVMQERKETLRERNQHLRQRGNE